MVPAYGIREKIIPTPVFIKSVKAKGVQEMTAELNAYLTKTGLPGIRYKKRDGTTAIIGVDNEDRLAEQMDSSGAISYITTVTYTLTSLLERRVGEVKGNIAGIARTGSLKTLDRLRDLTDYQEKMKFRFERHIDWLQGQIGSFQADLVELERER